MTTSRCRTCNAEIIFARMPSGRVMPLDAKLLKLFVLEPDGTQGGSPRAKSVDARQSHFASCPNADQHRSQR